jgi:hypothetical protein
VQEVLLQLELHVPGLRQVSSVKELESSQSAFALQTIVLEQSVGQLAQFSVPSHKPLSQQARVGFPMESQSGSVPWQALLWQAALHTLEQALQLPPEQNCPALQLCGTALQHCTVDCASKHFIEPQLWLLQTLLKTLHCVPEA